MRKLILQFLIKINTRMNLRVNRFIIQIETRVKEFKAGIQGKIQIAQSLRIQLILKTFLNHTIMKKRVNMTLIKAVVRVINLNHFPLLIQLLKEKVKSLLIIITIDNLQLMGKFQKLSVKRNTSEQDHHSILTH